MWNSNLRSASEFQPMSLHGERSPSDVGGLTLVLVIVASEFLFLRDSRDREMPQKVVFHLVSLGVVYYLQSYGSHAHSPASWKNSAMMFSLQSGIPSVGTYETRSLAVSKDRGSRTGILTKLRRLAAPQRFSISLQ